jgi:Zn-dependent M28 family amino/carboxypeptidase
MSTGAEEALWEGMRAFVARHLPELSAERTHLICVDSVGSPQLVLAQAEGNLRVLDYDRDLTDLLARCASDAGVSVRRGLTVRFGTDGYVALRHRIPAALLLSINEYGAPSNYHWRTDTPDRLDYGSLEAAVAICECAVRRLAAPPPAAPA